MEKAKILTEKSYVDLVSRKQRQLKQLYEESLKGYKAQESNRA